MAPCGTDTQGTTVGWHCQSEVRRQVMGWPENWHTGQAHRREGSSHSAASPAGQPFSSTTVTSRDFARLLATDLAKSCADLCSFARSANAQQDGMAMVADLLKPSPITGAGPPHGFFIARSIVVAKPKIQQFLANGSGAGRWPGRCSGYGWLLPFLLRVVDRRCPIIHYQRAASDAGAIHLYS